MAAKGAASQKKPTQQKTAQKNTEVKPQVPSLDVRIDRLIDNENSKLKAVASVNIGGAFAVHGIRVIDSQKGLFVSVPSTSYTDGHGETKYSDTFHPVTADARTELIDKVTEAYEQALAQSQEETEDQTAAEEEGFTQTM